MITDATHCDSLANARNWLKWLVAFAARVSSMTKQAPKSAGAKAAVKQPALQPKENEMSEEVADPASLSTTALSKDVSQNMPGQLVPVGKLGSESTPLEPAQLPEVPEKGSQPAKQTGVLQDMKQIARYVPRSSLRSVSLSRSYLTNI